jgi:hypothetical protein
MRRSKPPSSDHTLRGRQIPELRVQVGSDLKAHTASEKVPRTRKHVAGSGMAVKGEGKVRGNDLYSKMQVLFSRDHRMDASNIGTHSVRLKVACIGTAHLLRAEFDCARRNDGRAWTQRLRRWGGHEGLQMKGSMSGMRYHKEYRPWLVETTNALRLNRLRHPY